MTTECLLARLDDGPQLAHEPADLRGLVGAEDGAHVGQASQLVQQPTAEVDAVELRHAGRMGEGEGGQERGEQGALAAPGRSRDRQMTGPPGEVQQQRLLRLLEWPVDDPQRNPQPCGIAGPRWRRWRPGRAEHLAERDGRGERRQPDAMGPVPSAGERRHRGDHRLQVAARRHRIGRRALGQSACGRTAGTGGGGGPPGRQVGRRVRGWAADRVEGQDHGGRRPPTGGGGRLDGRRRHEQAGEGLAGAAVDLEQTVARGWRQMVGVSRPEDGPGLRGAEGAEADPVAQVAVEPAEAALLEALRRQ